MNNREAAATNYRAFIMAEFAFFAGRGPQPSPASFGYNGGNTVTVNGEAFCIHGLAPQTFPINAGF